MFLRRRNPLRACSGDSLSKSADIYFLENVKANDIFELIDNSVVFDDESTN